MIPAASVHRFLFPNELSPHVWRWAAPWWGIVLEMVTMLGCIGTLAVVAWRGLSTTPVWLLVAAAVVPALPSLAIQDQIRKVDRLRLIDLAQSPEGPAMWVLTRVRIIAAESLVTAALLSAALLAVSLHHGGVPGVPGSPLLGWGLVFLAIPFGVGAALIAPKLSAFTALKRRHADLAREANLWAQTQAERAAEGERTPWWAKTLW